MFRIENETVIEKSKTQEAAKAKKISTRTSPTRSTSPSKVSYGSPADMGDMTIESQIIKHSRNYTQRSVGFSKYLLPEFSMSPTLEERARCFFAANSVMWGPTFDFVDSFHTQIKGDEHLLASINAVGLASFSHSVHAPELMVRASRDYVLALRLTNIALRSPTEAKKDSTLFAVMVLSVFETIAGTSNPSLVAWIEHINGAAALIKLRGREQFKTAAGRRLFQQVTSNLMVSCIIRTKPMPAHMIELRKAAAHILDTSHPAWVLSSIVVDFTLFHAAIETSSLPGSPAEIMQQALELDQRFIDLFEHPPDAWAYDTVYTDDDPHLIWKGSYHIYKDTFAAQLWNAMRTCRIMLHEIIFNQLRLSASAPTPLLSQSASVAQSNASVQISLEMQADILASISYDKTEPAGRGSEEKPPMQSMGSFIRWPLYLVAVMDLSTDEIREWVVRRLQLIAEIEGVQQANIMASHLVNKDALQPWDPRQGENEVILEEVVYEEMDRVLEV